MSEQQEKPKTEKSDVCFFCGLFNRRQPDDPQFHDSEKYFRCPECKSYVEIRTRRFVKHAIIRGCCLCGRDFVLNGDDSIGREVCHSKFCVKKYRHFCGKGDRFWRTAEAIKKCNATITRKLRRRREKKNAKAKA